MNLRQAIASYQLGNTVLSEFPEIAVKAIEENYNSESLLILAGLNSRNLQ